jgi:hypothetical protein
MRSGGIGDEREVNHHSSGIDLWPVETLLDALAEDRLCASAPEPVGQEVVAAASVLRLTPVIARPFLDALLGREGRARLRRLGLRLSHPTESQYHCTVLERQADTLRRHADGEDIGDLARAAAARCRAALEMPMSERLARMHTLCKHMGAVRGAARITR